MEYITSSETIMASSGKHPKFQRQNYGSVKRVGTSWRKPHGIDSKQRVMQVAYGALPKIGFKGKKKNQHLHPRGKKENYVRGMKQLLTLEKGSLVRLNATIGQKLRQVMIAKAKEKGLIILNLKA